MRKEPSCIIMHSSQLAVGRSQTFFALGIVLLFGVSPVLSRNMVIVADSAISIITAVGYFQGWVVVSELGVFSIACITLSLFGFPSQLSSALGIASYAAIVSLHRRHSGVIRWFTAGAITRDVILVAAASFLLSAGVLVVWYLMVRPNIDDIIRTFVPDWPFATLVLGGLLFSMFNAAVEEVAYRGVVMNALDTTIGVGTMSLIGQAVAFGLLHIHGFPRGWSGVALACVFGILMGLIKRRSGGLLAPWATHVCTDAVIVSIVVFFART